MRLVVLCIGIGLTALVGTAPAGRADLAETTYLASIGNIAIGPNQYVDGFHIDTWGVDILAVCQVPWGWRVTAGRNGSADGVLSGKGSLGVTWLNPSTLTKLTDLALIRISGPVQPRKVTDKAGNQQPATFEGYASVGVYGSDADEREIALDSRNVRLRPASRCPPPNR